MPHLWLGRLAWAEAPNERLNVASIGVGGRGTDIGRQAASLGNMVACADVHRKNAEAFAKPYEGRCEIYTDYRKVLDRRDVDAVTIGTPDHWHVKIAIDAMKAGKDVYCEKPLTLTIEESKLICEAVQKTAKVFQVGTQQRSEFNNMFLKAVVIARSGRLGKKLRAVSSVGQATAGGPFPISDPPDFLDWDFWLGQAPKVPFCENRIGWNFRWWFEYSGGQVTDWGVHHTDIALWALGGEETGPVQVTPVNFEFPLGRELMLDTLLGKRPWQELPVSYNVAKSFECDMLLPNGNEVKLISGNNELIIEGELGKIRVNRGSLTGKPIEDLTEADKKWLDDEVRKLYRGKESGSHMRNFFDCVKDRSLPISDVFTHANSVNACHMANISMLLNRTVKWDPDKYEFPGDDEANALTRRPQREPYQIVL
ncbi:MAG: Gfo/Idh/MocA family oxidoreductase [Thermogutta sp.]|nr:Gfo/Idh/MocA family oxidoreductase [Thermogutta sp.]